MCVRVCVCVRACARARACVCRDISVCSLQCSEVDRSDGEQIRFPLKAPLCGANGSAVEVNAQ